MKFDISQYNPRQLKAIDGAVEAMIFKHLSEEPFEPSFKADPKNFRKFINNMVDFKRALQKYFEDQYQQRYRLFVYPGSLHTMDQYDDYLYDEEWQVYQDELAQLLEQYIKTAFDLGAIALALLLSIRSDYSSADGQAAITERAMKSAGDITTTTKNRVKQAIKTSLQLNEDRQAFENRIKSIFVNPWRGRFIAHEESINAYMEGKYGMAQDQGMQYKMCLSSQASDQICGGYNGQVVPIDAPFGNGMMSPQFHYGCRCDVAYAATKDGFQ